MARGRDITTGRRPRRGRGRRPISPLPIDSQAVRESSQLGGEAADTRATLAARFTAAQNNLGFGSGADNPYSATAENKRALAADQRANLNTAGNSLYSGATLNASRQARGRYDRNQKAIEAKASEAQGDYTRGAEQTAREEATGNLGIKEGAISRAAATEPPSLAVGGRRRGRGRPTVKPNNNRRRGRGMI
jgi:hypothetical protein